MCNVLNGRDCEMNYRRPNCNTFCIKGKSQHADILVRERLFSKTTFALVYNVVNILIFVKI